MKEDQRIILCSDDFGKVWLKNVVREHASHALSLLTFLIGYFLLSPTILAALNLPNQIESASEDM